MECLASDAADFAPLKAGHQDKANEIVDAAIGRLRSGGVDALSVAALARELGVAQNTIYWYFPSRDHLLVAAMGRMVQRIISEGAAPDGAEPGSSDSKPSTIRESILMAVDRFAEIYPLRIALRERARSSPVLFDFDKRLSDFLHEALHEAFEPYVLAADIELAIETFLLASDGCHSRGLGPAERRAVLGFVLDRLGVKD
jgi:AcrR family transcriptional regulator